MDATGRDGNHGLICSFTAGDYGATAWLAINEDGTCREVLRGRTLPPEWDGNEPDGAPKAQDVELDAERVAARWDARIAEDPPEFIAEMLIPLAREQASDYYRRFPDDAR